MSKNVRKLEKIEDLYTTSGEVGALVSIDYDSVVIASNDFYINQVNGIPKRCFLLAVPDDGIHNDVILLSVKNVMPLESTRNMQSLREDLATKHVANLDVATKSRLQLIGYQCDIIGSFYMNNDRVHFGSDVDRVLGHSSYKIVKPFGKSLSLIASFSRNIFENDALLDVGRVRYSETELQQDHDARVFIDVRDFIGKKTAVLSMSRLGKSNSIKIIAKQVFDYSRTKNKRIGQIIFDPQGEYANSNVQDGGSLANMGSGRDVVIYKAGAVADSGDREKPLLINFLEPKNMELVWSLMLQELSSGASSGANYISGLSGVNFEELPKTAPKNEKINYSRKRLGLYSLMHLSRMKGVIPNYYLDLTSDLVAELAPELHEDVSIPPSNPSQLKISSPEGAYSVYTALATRFEEKTLGNKSLVNSFESGDLAVFREQIEAFNTGRKGVTSAFMRLKELHSDKSKNDVRDEVWKDLELGKLVIIDLSRGSTKAVKAISELIVTRLIDNASERFINGKDMIPFQIIVEEAHNLFARDAKNDDTMDPWVRLSKEAAKYEIGLVYATQEVSSVDKRILSNTSNWFIAHINSKSELNELAGYYTFSDWTNHLQRSESKGFVRLKTESSPFIVPVQIDLFKPNKD